MLSSARWNATRFLATSVLARLSGGGAIYAQPPASSETASEVPPATKPAEATPEATAEVAPVAPAKAEDYDRLAAEWTALERQLANLIKNYQDAVAPALAEKILADYRQFANESKVILPQPRRSGRRELLGGSKPKREGHADAGRVHWPRIPPR